ncbi:MAG: bifunctional riboflavin kinase/FAD synthetase [Deltaproteobacteria bacterium]|nr:bifunctional riboflavin kinase/FAD synthetase [Deltaproteobacteria bacterium]
MATRIIHDFKELINPLTNPVLTIGNFDGVHKGHLVLFDKVKKRAQAINGQSAVMTFEPHPVKVIKPGNGPLLITPTRQKLSLISDSGIDVIFCIPFTHQFATISAQDFVMDILVKTIGIKEIVVGHDYTFGNKRQGNLDLLKKMGNESGFKVHIVEPVYIDKTLVSSTSIRRLVAEGDLSEAKRLLGRDYQITGTVVKGKDRGGKVLGIPTANIKAVDELIPRKGTYVVSVELDDRYYVGVCNIGHNPTFGENALSIETHVLDFSGDILGKTITVIFIQRLRDEKRFANVQELKEQISLDIEKARELFNLHEKNQKFN